MAPPSSSSSVLKNAAPTGSAKRQLSLFESMGVKSTPSTSASSPATKKARVNSNGPWSRREFIQSFSTSVPRASSSKASASLSEKELLALESETIDSSWLRVLGDEIRKPYFLDLKRWLWDEGLRGVETGKQEKVYPQAKDIYSWSRYTPLSAVKVIIIGQDPYHDTAQAHGLSFSVPLGITIPPSLRNIHANLRLSYPTEFPAKAPHGSLIASAREGVLWLNTSLTVGAHKAGSHKGKWERFTDRVLAEAVKERGVVVMCWGAWAQKRAEGLDKSKNLILSSVHPSPLSAHRGFMTNGHFVTANAWLEEKYGPEAKINWTQLNYDEKALPPIILDDDDIVPAVVPVA